VLRRTASWSLGLLALGVLQAAEAHEPPVVTGMVAGPDDGVVLRTTRGLVVGDLRGGSFSLQCLELSEFLPAETPTLTFAGARLLVSGVKGLVSMSAKGCDLERSKQFVGVPMTDVQQRPDGSLLLLTTGAGMLNDAWTSFDGVAWQARGLALEQTLYSSLRPFGAREVATGVRIDLVAGRPLHFVREVAGQDVVLELPIEVGPEGYRVHLLDVRDGADPEALVLVDQYRESATSDRVLRYRNGAVEELFAAPEIVDARYGPDGAVYAASASGLLRWRESVGAEVVGDGRRSTMVAVAAGSVFTATEYYIDGCALCRVEGDALVPLLRFGEIGGPTVCSEAPGVCDADWSDWRLEVAPAEAGSGSGAEPEVSADSNDTSLSSKGRTGCSVSSGSGLFEVALLVGVWGFVTTARRRRWLGR
jgi:hypothetical protein